MHSAVHVTVHGPDGPDRWRVTLRLACGCVVERSVARDRVLEVEGSPRAVGKYPCPVKHAVRPPSS